MREERGITIDELYSQAVDFATSSGVVIENGTKISAGKHRREGLIVVRFQTDANSASSLDPYGIGDEARIILVDKYKGEGEEFTLYKSKDRPGLYKSCESSGSWNPGLRRCMRDSGSSGDRLDPDGAALAKVLQETKPRTRLTRTMVGKTGGLKRKAEAYDSLFH